MNSYGNLAISCFVRRVQNIRMVVFPIIRKVSRMVQIAAELRNIEVCKNHNGDDEVVGMRIALGMVQMIANLD